MRLGHFYSPGIHHVKCYVWVRRTDWPSLQLARAAASNCHCVTSLASTRRRRYVLPCRCTGAIRLAGDRSAIFAHVPFHLSNRYSPSWIIAIQQCYLPCLQAVIHYSCSCLGSLAQSLTNSPSRNDSVWFDAWHRCFNSLNKKLTPWRWSLNSFWTSASIYSYVITLLARLLKVIVSIDIIDDHHPGKSFPFPKYFNWC